MDPPPALPAVRNHSPFGTLLVWLGPLCAIINLSVIPLFLLIIDLVFSGLFGRRPSPAKELLPLFIGVKLILVACIPAQALLLTLCLTWSTGSWWRRTTEYWLAILFATGTVLAGIPLHWLLTLVYDWATGDLEAGFRAGGPLNCNVDSESFWDQVRGITGAVCGLPMILLGVQTPFWMIRLFVGWRLARQATDLDESPPREPSAESLSIQDLMLTTAIVAASLALLQFADRVITRDSNETLAFLFAILMITGICLIVSLLTAVPLVVLFFSHSSLQFCWGATLLATGACAVAFFAIAQAVSPTTNPLDQLGITCALAYGYACGSAVGLTLLRRFGWRLRGRNR